MNAAYASIAPPPTSKTRTEGFGTPHRRTSPTLLLADANPWIRRELNQHLHPHFGADAIAEARSPSEVLLQVADSRCRVLVIDPCMPTIGQTDGVPLLRRICCLRRDLHILVLARQPQHLLRDKSFPRQIAHVCRKNISAARLYRFIDRALTQSEAA